MQTSIIINTTDTNGKSLQKTLPYANASASAACFATFGQKLTGLTSNTYNKTFRVDKIDCDNEDITITIGGNGGD